MTRMDYNTLSFFLFLSFFSSTSDSCAFRLGVSHFVTRHDNDLLPGASEL